MSRRSAWLLDNIYAFSDFYLNRMATKFVGQYVQSFLNVMKTQFGVEMMLFGGYLDNKENVNTFRFVVLYGI